jgi:hypothetical protein
VSAPCVDLRWNPARVIFRLASPTLRFGVEARMLRLRTSISTSLAHFTPHSAFRLPHSVRRPAPRPTRAP